MKTTIIVLVLLGAYVHFYNFLKEKHFDGIKLTEIEITSRKPRPLVYVYIDQCPRKLGELKEYLDCREELLAKYR